MSDRHQRNLVRQLAAAEALGLTVEGKANRYTALNGNMFTFLDRAGVICALPEAWAEDADALQRLLAASHAPARRPKPWATGRRALQNAARRAR